MVKSVTLSYVQKAEQEFLGEVGKGQFKQREEDIQQDMSKQSLPVLGETQRCPMLPNGV